MSNDIYLSQNKNTFNSVKNNLNKFNLNKNNKLVLFIQKGNSKGINIHLFKINPESTTGDNPISSYSFYTDQTSNLDLSNLELQLLSDSVNKLENFNLPRFIISDSIGSLIKFKFQSMLKLIRK